MGLLAKIVISISLLATGLIGIFALSQTPAVQNAMDTIGPSIGFIFTSIKNWIDVFPWFADVLLMFGAVLTIEGTLLIWRIYNYLHNKIVN